MISYQGRVASMPQHFLESPFWQSLAGSLLANAFFALLLSATVLSFFRGMAKQMWTMRQTIRLWLTVPLFIYFGLLAIRYNTVSAKESTIRSLQASVETLNRRLTPRHLTENQRKALVMALTEMPAGTVPIYFNIGDSEALPMAQRSLIR